MRGEGALFTLRCTMYRRVFRESVERTEGVDRSLCQFQEDPSVHPFFRSTKSDYKYRCSRGGAGEHRNNPEQ